MLKPSKYEQLYQDLKKEVIKLIPGDSYPSMRTIMRQYGVSQATVTKASEKLFNEGLLEKYAGKEMIVTEEVNKYKSGAMPTICLAVPHWQSDWNSVIEHDFYELKKILKYNLEVIHYDWHEKVIRQLPSVKIDGLVIVPSASLISVEDISELDNFGIPYVLFCRHLSGLAVSSVSADNRHSGALAANHLIELGHKRIATIITQPKLETIEERIEGFKDMCALRNVEFIEFDCEVSDGDYCVEKVYHKFMDQLNGKGLNFTGGMTMCQDSCIGIYRAMYEHNLNIPDDLSLIGIGQSRIYDFLYPPLTSLNTSSQEMVTEAINILKPKITNKNNCEIIQKQVKPQLIIRNSTTDYK